MELTGQAHGKVLLFGEHAVVYGHPALGFTLPLTTCVRLSSSTSEGPDHGQLIDRLVPHLGEQARHIWQQYSWHVSLQSDVPMGQGLGSSAALTGAVARAFSRVIPGHNVWEMAHRAEREFHGTPSGVDTALALGQGLATFQPGPCRNPQAVACAAAPFALVVGAVPRTTHTRVLVADVHRRLEESRASLEQLGAIAGRVAAELPQVKRQVHRFLGTQASEAHEVLKKMGLSTPYLDRVIHTGCQSGADGGKLSGAGGGGAFVLFCQDEHIARHVALSIRRASTEPCFQGCSVLKSYLWDGTVLRDVTDKTQP